MSNPLFLGAQVLATAAVLSRLATGARRHAALSPAASPPKGSVSIVIPARNEAARIGACLIGLDVDSLHEVIVVDDESTDATAAVAAGFGAKVIAGQPLPDGWVGKPWALQQGLEAATGEWVIFLDADTIPQPGLPAAAIAAAEQLSTHVLTLAPSFVCDTVGQQVLHASMLSTLAYRFLPVGTTVRSSPRRTIGNGQCMVMRRAWLESQGGFEAAAAHMTDDIAFVRAMAARGANVAFEDGSAVLQVRMHDSTGDVWREWGRSLPMSDIAPKRDQYLDLATVWLTMALPLVRILTGRSTGLDKFLVVLRFLVCLALQPSYRDKAAAVWLSPFADVASAVRLTETTWQPVRSWRGRSYPPAESADR